MIRRFPAELIKDSFLQFKSLSSGTVADDKFFIGIVLMKLDFLNVSIILFPHHQISKPFCCKCFSYSGRTLQDQIHLVPEQ